ncbi:MAG: alpha/beta fold hydrolase [Pseudomonadota bacterium]
MIKSMLSCLLLAVCTACASGGVTENDTFPAPEADFAAHVDKVHAHIAAQSLFGRGPDAVALNLPFELGASPDVPYRGKLLLFHGLNDSAYVWTDMAKVLAAQGFDVRSVLLPGHGSHPDAMLEIAYSSWIKAARAHLALWDVDDTPMYLGGFSLGGVLATALALDNPDIAGLLLISPAYKSRLNHLLRWSWLYNYYETYVFGGIILEDNPIKYNSIPINSGTQYYNATRYLANRWGDKRLRMPVMMVVTDVDSVVDVDHSRGIFQSRVVHPDSRLLIYSNDADLDARDGEIVRGSHYPERRILNQSHLSLLNAPDNPLFGQAGRVLVCNGNEYPIFMACMRAREHWFGAQHTPSPDGVPVARTTYNPDFPYLFTVFDQVFFEGEPAE